jgi:SAM-dependent methyltransferase
VKNSSIMRQDRIYGKAFYEDQMGGSLLSAREVVPIILRLLDPASVVDVGCGVGTWLSVFREHSIEDVVGVDGSYVDKSLLHISPDRFTECDLSKGCALNRNFDLAISLEVAEHLPPESADVFVRDLTRLSDAIVFSAAVPGQGGTNHVNEQWPTYWKHLFEARGFILVDCFRKRMWDNRNIACCYRQNMFLFMKEGAASSRPELLDESRLPGGFPLCAVHPEVLSHALSRPLTLRPLLRALPRAVLMALERRLPAALCPGK